MLKNMHTRAHKHLHTHTHTHTLSLHCACCAGGQSEWGAEEACGAGSHLGRAA